MHQKALIAALAPVLSLLLLSVMVAEAGAQAPATLSSDFSGASLDTAVWQTPSPAASAVVQSGELRLVNGSAIGRSGTLYGPRTGLCLEPQHFPDAPNHSNFPESRLDPGEVYINRVVYGFATGAEADKEIAQPCGTSLRSSR